MTSAPTYYDLFGVTPAASPAQLRAAYLALMKIHHPDRVDGAERHEASDYAALLNRSYAILKDPAARARYNAQLADQSFLFWRKAPRRTALLTGAVYRRQRQRLDMTSVGTGLLIVATALIALTAALVPPRQPMIAWAGVPETVKRPGPLLHDSVALEDRQARDQARRAILATRDEAIVESRDCFRAARLQLSRRDTELCVIFDEAYLDWQDSSSVPPGPDDYFNQLVVSIRHRDAMAALGGVPPFRLDQLRDVALDALLAEIRDAENQLPPQPAYRPGTPFVQVQDLSQ